MIIVMFCFIFAFMFLAYLNFGHFIDDFCTITDAFTTIFSISIVAPISYHFLTIGSKVLPKMTMFLFIPMTMIFIFIFTNIYLAMIQNSYEINRGSLIQEGESDDDTPANYIQTAISNWCMKKKGRPANLLSKNLQRRKELRRKHKSASNMEGDVLGIA
jgi:hypothetical protein